MLPSVTQHATFVCVRSLVQGRDVLLIQTGKGLEEEGGRGMSSMPSPNSGKPKLGKWDWMVASNPRL
jgi:hypothetical protein